MLHIVTNYVPENMLHIVTNYVPERNNPNLISHMNEKEEEEEEKEDNLPILPKCICYIL